MTAEFAKLGVTCLMFRLKIKCIQLVYLMEMVSFVLPKREVVGTKHRNFPHGNKNISVNHTQPHPNLNQKRLKSFHLRHNHGELPFSDKVNENFVSSLFIKISLQ